MNSIKAQIIKSRALFPESLIIKLIKNLLIKKLIKKFLLIKKFIQGKPLPLEDCNQRNEAD